MAAFVYLGYRFTKASGSAVDNLYTGTDATVGDKAARDAAKNGPEKKLLKAGDATKYHRIVKLVNPIGSPLPIVDMPIKCTTPVWPKRKAPELPKAARPPKHIEESEAKLRDSRSAAEKQRQERLQPKQGEQSNPEPKGEGQPQTKTESKDE